MVTQTEADYLTESRKAPPAGERIKRLQRRYRKDDVFISIERARYFTESWEETAKEDIALPVRVAMAMRNVYENMTHYLDPDDRIAGYWTEFFLGCPIDIERGVFNQVLEAELTKGSMLYFRIRSLVKGLVFLLRNRSLVEFLHNQRMAKKGGTTPLNMTLKTMGERSVNPYRIRPDDRRLLRRRLLPRWKGKTVVDQLESELAREGLFSARMHEFTTSIAGNTSRQVLMLSPCATIATFQGHLILDFGKVLTLGLEGMLEEVRKRLEEEDPASVDRDFLRSVEIAIEGVMTFAGRLAERIEKELETAPGPDREEVLARMLETCRRVPMQPADTFREAVQSMWTVKTAVELAHPVNLHCFGRIDQDLYPYYRADLEAGSITPDEARELIEELLLKIMSQNIRPESNILGNFYHRYLGSAPVTVGGQTSEGGDATNDVTYLVVQAAHNSRAVTNV
jgi:hypothetical protein